MSTDPEQLDTENPEWTAEDFKKALRAQEILPVGLLHKLQLPITMIDAEPRGGPEGPEAEKAKKG
jgi:hypothetical protein